MSWASLHPDVQTVAQTTLTQKQLDVWKLELAGASENQIARILDCSRWTVRDHLATVTDKLSRAGIRQSVTGRFYLKETA